MARKLHTLSARTVATLTKPGRHSDGGGLYLNITATGARSWVFMWKADGKRREMGLGALRDVPLAKAYCATIWIEERGDHNSDLLSRQDDDCRATTRMQVLS